MSSQIVPYSDESRQPQSFKFGDFTLCPIVDNGEDVFVAGEVCAPLGLTNVSQALARLDDDEKREIISNDVTGRQQYIWVVTESGLYSLINSSRKPIAKTFKRWINHEVLPAIRKTGGYQMAIRPPSQLDIVEGMVLALRTQERQLAELQEQQAQTNIALENMNAKLEDRDFMSIETWCKVQGIKEGIRSVAVRIKWGKEAAALSRANSIEIKHAVDEAHTPGRYHVSVLRAVCVPRPRTNGQLSLIGGGK